MSGLYYGGDSISSIDEYLDRINKMHRAPTTRNGDFPVVPRSSSYPEEHKDHHRVKIFHEVHQQQEPEVHKKVHFSESEKHVEIDDRRGKHHVYEETITIDMEADGFIQQRHRDFESGNTYKGY